jgi:hypothetical protein
MNFKNSDQFSQTSLRFAPLRSKKMHFGIDTLVVPLTEKQRGLVVSSPITITRQGISAKSTSIDPDELRLYLLFWDRLDFPENNLLGIGLDADAAFLREAGILSRSRVMIVGEEVEGTDGFLQAHLAAFKNLDQIQPGRWSMARGEKSISFPSSDFEEARALLFELHRCIPIPRRDVHLNDVLQFRERRLPESLALRDTLERIYQEILKAPDRRLAQMTEFSALDRAIANHILTIKEAKFPLSISGLKATLNLGTVTVGSAAFQASLNAGLPLVQSLAHGVGAGAAASIGLGFGFKGQKRSASPFEYISKIENELF